MNDKQKELLKELLKEFDNIYVDITNCDIYSDNWDVSGYFVPNKIIKKLDTLSIKLALIRDVLGDKKTGTCTFRSTVGWYTEAGV